MTLLCKPITLLGIALYCATQAAIAGVYKCPDGPNRHRYQDTPCADGKVISVKPAMGSDQPSAPAAPKLTSSYPRSSPSDPMVGMGKQSLMQALGTPSSSAHTTDYTGAQIESLTFIQHGKAIVAYLKDGFVFKTTTVERDWIGQPTPNRNCPSATEIRNAETSAGSISLTDDQRRDKQYDIARMKACLPR